MLLKTDVRAVITDIFRTELGRYKKDALAVFDTQDEIDLSVIPEPIKQKCFEEAGSFFSFTPRAFARFDLMCDFAYASYLKNRKVVFSTSGSTGTPKHFPHSERMLEEEGAGVGKLFSGAKRLIAITPRNHLYGFFFYIVFARVWNIPSVHLPPIPTQNWTELLREGDVLAGFPLFWHYWLKAGNKFPQGVHAVSSTAPCPDDIINGLKEAGAAQFSEVYGASETGGIAYRTGAGEPFAILPYWEISLREEQPLIKRASQDNWVVFPDEVEVVKERFIRPLKRTDACVQVAGVNVYPKHTEEILAKHPAVKACKVRLMRPEEGKRLKAFIVPHDGFGAEQLPDIRRYLAENLSVHEQPRGFTFGNELPVSPIGKDADW